MTPRQSLPRVTKFIGVGARQIRVVASDGAVDRCGDIVEPSGAMLDAYRRNPIVLAQHDPAKPIGRCATVGLEGNQIVATIQFPEENVSAAADEYYRLMKAGVLGAVSIGFRPLACEPIQTGLRFTKWELLEISVVSVPANPSALVTEKLFALGGLAARAAAIQKRIASTRAGDDGSPAAGNCGRPLGSECGMTDESECAIHSADPGTADGEKARRERVALLRARHGFKQRDPRALTAEAAFRLWCA